MLKQYDISKTYLSFSQGISDDDFIWPENSIEDMDSIDIQSHERYAQADTAYYLNEDYSLAGWASWFKNTTVGNFISNLSVVQYQGSSLALSGTVWDGMATYWSGVNQSHYFFERTSWVKLANYNGTSIGAFLASGYPTANVQITGIGWHIWNILFCKENIVYFFDTWTNTTSTAVTLRPWTRVLYTYTINLNSIVLVCTNWATTYIAELEFTGWAYNTVFEIENNDFTVLWAVGNTYDVFLIGTEWLYQYQGRQIQHVKYMNLTSSAKISYDKWVIIADSNYVHKFSKKKPWRNYIYTKTAIATSLVSNGVILQNVSWGYKTYAKASAYKRANTITTRPLDGGSFATPKCDLSYRIWYITPKWNTPTAETEKAGIKIEVQTDEMERDAQYVTVFEEYEDFLGYIEITAQNVAQALENEWYKSEFGYARTRVTLYAGDEIWTTNVYNKTPKLFDLTINANYVKR